MSAKPSLSFIVPAFNEQENIRPACETLLRLAPAYCSRFEILVIDDCSSDATWDIVREMAARDARVRPFRNPRNMGLGYNYHFGVREARGDYVMLVPGDNEASEDSLRSILQEAGKADILVTHIANRHARPLIRQIVSRAFTHSMNFLFGLRLQYYNGINVIRAGLVRQCPPATNGFAYMALILVQLLKQGYTYNTAGFFVQKRAYGTTKAFRLKNVASVISSVLLLWKKIYIERGLAASANKASPPLR